MPSVAHETNVITLPGNRIILTSRRLLYVTELSVKEIFLADLVSYEVVQKKSRFLRGLFLMTAVPATILLLLYIGRRPPFSTEDYLTLELYGFILGSLIIGLCSQIYTKSHVRISGRYSVIEFPENEIVDPPLSKFLDMITVESEKQKKRDDLQ